MEDELQFETLTASGLLQRENDRLYVQRVPKVTGRSVTGRTEVTHMAEGSSMKAAGRRAGLAYLVLDVLSTAGYTTLTGLLSGNSEMLLARLASNQTPLTLALVSSALGFAAWIVLGILLYRLMGSAGRISGLFMLIFAVAGTAMNMIALSQLLPLVSSATSDMAVGTLAPIVQSYKHLLQLAQVFSGLWLFPFGWLVLRSHVAPRLLGVCLIFGGLFWLLQFALAFEPWLDRLTVYRVASAATGIPGVVGGEFGMCLWLLIKGGSEPRMIIAD